MTLYLPLRVLDEHTPVTEKCVKKQVQPPWMSNDIKEAMKEREKHLKRARRWNLTDDWLCYRCAKNKTTNFIKKAKHNKKDKKVYSLL